MPSCRMASTICVSVIVLMCASSQAQPPTSAATSVVRRSIASSDLSDLPHVEPRMAVNPKNGQNLVVAAMLFRRDGGGDSACTVLSSGDEGVTWRRSTLPTSEGLTGGGDPWVAFDDAGVAYLSCMHGTVTNSGERTSAVAVYRSADGGVTWSAPACGRFQTPAHRRVDSGRVERLAGERPRGPRRRSRERSGDAPAGQNPGDRADT
jgi:hypothetical protein